MRSLVDACRDASAAPASCERVGRDGGSAAAAGDHHELAAGRFVARCNGEQLDGLDEFVVALDLDDAAAAQERREDLGIAGERAGVGLHHDPTGGGAAGLKQEQRLAPRIGFGSDADQLARVL